MSIEDDLKAAIERRHENIRDCLSSLTAGQIRAILAECIEQDMKRVRTDPKNAAGCLNWIAYGLGVHHLCLIAEQMIQEKQPHPERN